MKRRLVKVFLAVLALFVLLNVVAYRHAYRMTHFVPAGTKTKSPEKLSLPAKMWTLLRGVEIPKPVVGPVKAEFPQPARTVNFVTRDGVKLEAWDIPASKEKGVAVMFHGYAVSRSALLGEARVLHELGWRTVLVDFRGSGGSEGDATTLGWREAMDVTAATSWTRREWPGVPVILYGQSMGAVAVLRAIATEGVKADGIILACPFDTLVHTVAHRYQAMGLPWFPFTQMLVFWAACSMDSTVSRTILQCMRGR